MLSNRNGNKKKGKNISKLDAALKLTNRTSYLRPHYNSTMSAPEWRNVEMAKDFANFLSDGRSMFSFPYFRQVIDLWKVIFQSYKHARKYDSTWNILTSEYMTMDLFIGTFTMWELIPKGILSAFLRPFLSSTNQTTMQQHLADYYTNYHKDLQTVPFYDQKYAALRDGLALKYKNCTDKTWQDWLAWRCTWLELTARSIISTPLHKWFHDENNIVTPTTDVLVKFKAENIDDLETAKILFKVKVATVTAKIAEVSSEAKPEIIDEIYASKKPQKTYTSIYARLRATRYGDFQKTVKELGEQGIYISKIAGHDNVQVKCLVQAETPNDLEAKIQTLNSLFKDVKPLYTYGDGIHSNMRFCLFDAPTKHLHETIKAFSEQAGTEVKFVHNF